MLKNLLLIRYWLVFEENPIHSTSSQGVGVTAYSYTDATNIVQSTVFKDTIMPVVKSFVENIDVSTLDELHIQPNMLPSTFRGVWYPAGY